MRPAPIPFEPALRARLSANLAAHRVHEHPLDGRRHAAVAIVLVDSEVGSDRVDPFTDPIDMTVVPEVPAELDGRMTGVAGGAAFLLSRRPSRMNRHAAQWALPGGRIDPGETPLEAALRELHEELGLLLTADACVGRLDDYPTRSGYVISPFVLWADAGAALVENPAEVAATYRIGLHELCRTDSPRFVTIPESDRPVVQLALGRDLIHAPTAAPLLQFRWVGLEGRLHERVDDYEQPVFAWR